ncbi:dTDP-4-dehydrorhamnose reductase [Tenacibaculum sp. SSH1-16]|uniref:dTDP-4-dehydrorhamnose reductase n=1 Tax=Tenacibaculum sp. SSH1-16 TaxID=3136667 RepID=UPI0032C488C6|nr:dTDP-4-dehydrorhamnose reductase [Tenacibaculum mesophilum]
MNILITGATGQLGSEIRELSSDYMEYNFFFENSMGLDIIDYSNVNSYIKSNKIDVIINCAAYTAVDKAEEAKEEAEAVNSIGVYNLAKSINNVGGKLIHISTDYVFSGDNYIPYKEEDEINPIGVYGSTKRHGEEFFINSEVEGIVIRTSWVYSSYGNNFVKTMLRLGRSKHNLNVIFDQVGSPTYARDLAKVCLDLVKEDLTNKSKIYHYSNEGIASWYDFSKAIMEFDNNITCVINPIESKDYPTPAKRPHYSVLNKGKIKKDFNIEIPYWRDSLNQCVKKIKKDR